MPGMFCRHNRLTSKCPICSRELDENLRSQAPSRPRAKAKAKSSSRGARSTSSRPRGVVTRKLARAADDGYRNPLVPGLRATADAERLAVALTGAAARLEPPGPYPQIAEEPDVERATWTAFLLALGVEDEGELTPAQQRTADSYRAWFERAGSQQAAFTGEETWTPERRFGRVFERFALPGLPRGARFDMLAVLGAAERYPLAADAVHFVEDDATTLAAKRALVSGDRLLLERRARELADAAGLPIAALDRGLANWGTPGAEVDLGAEPDEAVAAALGLG
jgi:hypothetical protein